MENLLNFCLKIMLLAFLLTSCQQSTPLYKRTFSEEEKLQYAENFLNGRGYYYQGSEDWKFVLNESIEHNPEHPDFYREMGIPPLKRGVISEFYAPYEQSVQLDPGAWQGYRGYIYLYFYRDYDRAIKDFDEADALTPNFVDYPQAQSVDFMRGTAYLMKGDYDNALDYLDKHFNYEQDEIGVKYMENRNFLYKGIAYLKKGDLKMANSILDLGLKHNPRSPDLAYWKAKVLLAENASAKEIKPYLEVAKTQFNSRNVRSYTEQFFQLYWSDVEELEQALAFRD